MFENMWQGEKIRLRAPTMADLDGFFHQPDGQNTASQRSGDRVMFPISKEQRRARMEDYVKMNPAGGDYFLLMEARDGTVVGNINTHSVERLAGNFAYGIGVLPEHRGKGYASEAIRLLLRFYFNEMFFHKCNAHIYDFNQESIRLHERFGFVLEGRIRKGHFSGGRHCDVMHYGMTREEFWEKYGV